MENLPQENYSKTTTGEDDRRKMINLLVASFKLAWPMFLKGQIENDVIRMWNAHLGETPLDQINKAMFRAVHKGGRFAPTIGEFMSIIREVNTRTKAHEDGPLRIAHKGSQTIGMKALDSLARLTNAKRFKGSRERRSR